MIAPRPDTPLDDIRREIDEIDDAILDLIVKRFAATDRVAAAKANDGSIAVSPFRPAREASLLRRLVARGQGHLSSQFLVRLWRVILSSSTQAQAAVTIHTGPDAQADSAFRIRLSEHFCGMEVVRHESVAEALQTLCGRMGDLAVIPAASDWPAGFLTLNDSTAKVIGRLPVWAGSSPALILGHADAAATGDDETLVITRTTLPPSLMSACRWSVALQGWTVAAFPGFLGGEDAAIRAFLSADPDARIAGRYPTPIEIPS